MEHTNGFIYALQESHLPGVIICAILLLLSAFSWTVMITKFMMLRRARRQTALFLDYFRRSRTPLDAYCENAVHDGTPLYWIYSAGGRELTFQLLGSSQADENTKQNLQRADKISESQAEAVANSMDRTVGEVAIRLEGQMTLLATVVSGSPFLGLLGTVWGVMETFAGVASAGGGASLQSMAPGVSAALVTTVVALLVAIPAKFGYNFLVNSIKGVIVRMDNFAAELTSAFQRHYVDHGRRFEALPSFTAMGAETRAHDDQTLDSPPAPQPQSGAQPGAEDPGPNTPQTPQT
ncbi:MAG: MotA/TolQ/ExbB proton channel family protein, partial [Verrucomicrobiales bacterium]